MKRSLSAALFSILAVSVMGLVACSDTTTEPAKTGLVTEGAAVVPEPTLDVVASVTGNGHFLGDPRDRSTTFAIRKYADGTVEGWYKAEGRGPGGAHVFIAFDCLHVQGNQAWASGVYVKAVNPDNIGRGFTLRVIDNGEGARATPDQIGSDRFNAYDCTTEPDIPLRPLEMGNLQVRGRPD